jgi:hypothetical protein
MNQRIERYSEWSGNIGENIIYDFGDAVEAVCNWLIDDGLPQRGHRDNILSSDHDVTGVGVSPHSNMNNIAVVDFAKRVVGKGNAPRSKVPSGTIPSRQAAPQPQVSSGSLRGRFED